MANIRPKTAANYVMTYLRTIAVIVICLPVTTSLAADPLYLANDSTIVVSADEAWEDPEQDVLHFRGNFDIRTPNWQLQADRASIYGKLSNLQRILADGTIDGVPVRFSYQDQTVENATRTKGEGQHLEYDSERHLLILSGSAVLTSGTRNMQSSRIQYNLETEQFDAGGDEGVHVTVTPKSKNN